MRAKKDGYAPGDRIGQTGLEATYDSVPPRRSGHRPRDVDALGRVKSARAARASCRRPATTVRLTIDADLQMTAEEAIDYGIRIAHEDGAWAADGGALVAMDPTRARSSRSRPTRRFDPSIYVGGSSRSEWTALRKRARTTRRSTAPSPGCIRRGRSSSRSPRSPPSRRASLSPDEPIQCTGKEVVDGQTFTNWDPSRTSP